jgi:hypothetical protein
MPNTLQQRYRREAFVRNHEDTFRRLTAGNKYTNASSSTEILAFINDVARPTLGYAAGTDADSIWFTLHRAYKKLFPAGADQ